MTNTNKTRSTTDSVEAAVSALRSPEQQADVRRLCLIFTSITNQPPTMWGSSIIGFGSYHYKYASGREGDMTAAGFSPRTGTLVIYLVDGTSRHTDLLARLGPHTTGRACLYIKRLSDVDVSILQLVLQSSYRYIMAHVDTMHRAQ